MGCVWVYMQKVELRYWWEYGDGKTGINWLNEKCSLIPWGLRVPIWKIYTPLRWPIHVSTQFFTDFLKVYDQDKVCIKRRLRKISLEQIGEIKAIKNYL